MGFLFNKKKIHTPEERRRINNDKIKSLGIACFENLPMIESSTDVNLKDIDTICKRAIASLLTIQVACDVASGNDYEESKVFFTDFLNRFDVSECLLEKEKKSFYFAPDTKELYRGSLKERYDAYKIAIESGFKTRNEIRYMEDDDALEGLDVINLGLGDVLLNTKTGLIYTPNTNTMVKMGGEADESTENPQGNSEGDDVTTEANKDTVTI